MSFVVLVWNTPYKDAGALKGPYPTLDEALRRAHQFIEGGLARMNGWDRAEVLPLGEGAVEVVRDASKA